MGERGKEEDLGGLEMQFGEGIVGGGKGEEDLARWLLQGPLLLKLFSFYNPVRIIYNLSAG